MQAYAYGAWRAAAAIARRLKRRDDEVRALRQRAEDLRKRFDQAFFDEALGTYVLALDGDKRPCRVRSSNAGHALLTGIALPERAERVVRDLMQPSSFSGWGIRTVPTTEARYNPMSYHNGSVWPHDNALIAAGMARYGYRGRGGADLPRAVRGLDLHRPEAAAGAVLRLPAAAQPRADLLSGRLLAAGLGGGVDLVAGAVLPRARLRPGGGRA